MGLKPHLSPSVSLSHSSLYLSLYLSLSLTSLSGHSSITLSITEPNILGTWQWMFFHVTSELNIRPPLLDVFVGLAVPFFCLFFLQSFFFASPGALKREVPAGVGDGVTYEHFERADELRTFHTVSISNQRMSCEHFQTGVLSEHSGSGTAEGWQPKERSLPVPRNALKSVA